MWPAGGTESQDDLTIITWGNGAYLSRQAQHTLATTYGVRANVLDLRWIAPLPVADMLTAAHQVKARGAKVY